MHQTHRVRGVRRSALVALAFALPALALALGPQLSGRIRIDGSSTVEPIMTATAALYAVDQPRVRVSVGQSGTGGGFKKFLEQNAELRTDISDASRVIKPIEIARAKELGIEFIELPIALDGIAVVVNPKNDWCDHLTVAELKKIWQPGSKVSNWKDVREGFPDVPLKLYGPGPDNGTFDHFTESVCGGEKQSRSDYTASESDRTLVVGVSGDRGALGYFGFSYYETNQDKLKLLAVENKAGKQVKPTRETIRTDEYNPLARPLFIYVNKQSAQRPEVRSYVNFFFDNAHKIVEHPMVAYVALSDEEYRKVRERFDKGVTGSRYAEGHESELFGGQESEPRDDQ